MGNTIQFPGLWPRSSMSCQVQISHSAAHSMSQSPARSLRQVGCTVPLRHSLWVCTAEISLRARQTLLESSLQSSCPPFLTNAWLFTLPTFQAVWRLSKSRSNTAQLLPSPGVTKHPSFSGASVHSPSGCVPSLCVFHFHSTSPSDFQHPGPS